MNKSAMHNKFYIVGESYVDYICIAQSLPGIGEDATLQQPMTSRAGGSPLNTATHLQSLVKDEGICVQTCFNPNDAMGKILLEHAETHGISIVNDGSSASSNGSTPHCIVLVTGSERSFLTHRGCAATWQLSAPPVATCTPKYLNIAGYYCTPEFATSLPNYLRKVRESGDTIISLVTQFDVTQEWDGGLVDTIIPLLDILIMNEVEATSIMRAYRGDKNGNEGNVEDWIEFYRQKDVISVITMGQDGAIVFRNQTIEARIKPAGTNVVDSTGAGDAFAAGFLYGHYRTNGDLKQALKWGCAVGSASVTVLGASVQVERSVIEKHLVNQLNVFD